MFSGFGLERDENDTRKNKRPAALVENLVHGFSISAHAGMLAPPGPPKRRTSENYMELIYPVGRAELTLEAIHRSYL